VDRAFAGLVLALVAVTVWAVWDDRSPEWRRYQQELVRREVIRLEAELAEARAELERPGAQADLARLDAAAKAARGDSAESSVTEDRDRLSALEARGDSLAEAVRRAEQVRKDGPVAHVVEDLTKQLDAVQRDYVTATGTWPPDTLRLASLWALRDSLADALIEAAGPAVQLRAQMDSAWADAQRLRVTLAKPNALADSLARARAQLLAPVTSREAALARLRRQPLRIRELSSADGLEVARCPTCHGTLDDPPGSHPPLPALEVFRDLPCTVCHRGRGRALEVESAHHGMLTAAGSGGGPHSLRSRIEALTSADPAAREAAREELRKITGIDASEELAATSASGDPDSAAALAWARWWRAAQPWFEPGDLGQEDVATSPLFASGVDPWNFTVRGRPLKYVGSRKCLGCHEVLHREHSRRWIATKFRSFERLVGVADRTPCLPCHTTGFDPTTGSYAEPGVTCEGCHGPGERYDEMMVVGQEMVGRGEETAGRVLLAHASRLAREAASRRTVPGETGLRNSCVVCHGPQQQRAGCPSLLERDGVFVSRTVEESDAAR
jgi:hypothetical protein